MYFLNLYKLVNQQNAEEVECSSDRKVIFFLYSLLLQRVEILKFRILLSGSTGRQLNRSKWIECRAGQKLNVQNVHRTEMYFLNLYKLVNQQNAHLTECSSDQKVIYFPYSLLLQRVEILRFQILLSGSTGRRLIRSKMNRMPKA